MLNQNKFIFILLCLILKVSCAIKNGSLVSLDDYAFSSLYSSNQFYSTYFLNFNKSLDLKLGLSQNNTKNVQSKQTHNLKAEEKDSLYLKDDPTGLSFFAKIEISKNNGKDVLTPALDYYVNSTSLTPIITDHNLYYAPYLKKINDTYEVKIENLLKGVKYDFNQEKMEKSSDLGKLIKFENLGYLNFALFNNTNSNSGNNSFEFRIVELDSDKEFKSFKKLDFTLDSNTESDDRENNEDIKVENFWILTPLNNFYQKNNKSSTTNVFYQTILAISNKDMLYLFSLSDNKKLRLNLKVPFLKLMPGSSGEDMKVTKVGIWNDYLIISSMNNGINIYKYDKLKKDFKFFKGQANFFDRKGKIDNFPVKDFVINKNTLYCLIQNFGFKIYSLKDWKLLDFEFYHPFLMSFDKRYNHKDLSFRNYRGILIDNSKTNIPEFFMELNIDIEESPVINKMYSYSRTVKALNSIHDGMNSYIFDNISRTLFIIRRSLNPIAPSLIYKIDLSKFFYKNKDKFYIVGKSDEINYRRNLATSNDPNKMKNIETIYFFNSNLNSPNSTDYFILNDLKIGGNKIKFEFTKKDDYLVTAAYSTLPLNNTLPLQLENKNYINNKILFVKVKDHSNFFAQFLIGFIIGVLLLLVILLICYFCRKKKKESGFISRKTSEDNVIKATEQDRPYIQTESSEPTQQNNPDENYVPQDQLPAAHFKKDPEPNVRPRPTQELIIEVDDNFVNKKFKDI
jgi:hypothetical protein